MAKKIKIPKKIKKGQRGGSIKKQNFVENNTDFTFTQILSIILLIIALILGVLVYTQKVNRKKGEKVIYRDRYIDRPIDRPRPIMKENYYEEKIDRKLEPPGVVYEPDRYMPRRYVQSPVRGVPINIRTRGSPTQYQQMGILTNTSNPDDVRPLYGRQTYRGSNQWNYYSSLDSNLSTKIPIFKATNKCTDERGCQEINDGDNVTIGNISATQYTFTKYSNDDYRYIPDLF
tara:strand:+ start:785 stop:1477 length:693 start_codon:yes stop_codon:yes gene_type:complete